MPEFYNDALDDVLSYERMESFGGGMDGFTRATLIGPDQFQYSENGVIPDNFGFKTRPGADTLGGEEDVGHLQTEDGGFLTIEGGDNAGGKIILQPTTMGPGGAACQGLIYFDTPIYEQLITATNGNFFYWDGANWIAMPAWVTTDVNARFSAAQGVDTALFVDGTDMRIWDGANWSDAFPDNNTPRGATVVVWHAGRMWAMGFPGNTAGKENDAIWASALLAFGPQDWNGTDRQFRIGQGDGDPIIGAWSLQDFTMAIGKQNSIYLIRTDPRDVPANYQASIAGETVSYGAGLVGRRAGLVYGNDFLFVSPDKNIYSLQRMQAAAGQYQLSSPISRPMQPIIDRINWNHAHKIACKKYRELALFAVPLDASIVPNTVLVWNGRLGGGQGRWVGVWTGWQPTCWEVTRFGGVHRLVFGDNRGMVPQWKDFQDLDNIDTYKDDGVGYPTRLWTRSMLFGEPLNDKDAFYCEQRFAVSQAVVNTTAVSDNVDWATWSHDLRQEGPSLPIPQLPFDLLDTSNVPKRRTLRGRPPFNEQFLKIESDSGFLEVRNISLAAFLNTLANR